MIFFFVKFEVMLTGLRAKFGAPGPLKSLLISTGNQRLCEDSPYDREWGTGALNSFGKGKNKLGLALEMIRKELTE